MNSLQSVGELVRRLKQAVDSLAQAAARLNLPPLEQTEWYQLMTQKLLPQLSDRSYLVVAVVGGTNIGKSVVFNHLCGEKVSATSPLASGTKHPTCIAAADLARPELLAPIFSEFQLVESDDPGNALQDSQQDLLFWRESTAAPGNLLLLDTPDIDSDAEVNWERADKIRRAADVLIAVLTQQKYNDAAVKKFFRIAAAEGKSVLVVFNQCLLPDDETYWPIWLDTFCQETGIEPKFVYLAEHNRPAAENNQLAFFLRDWPVDTDASKPRDASLAATSPQTSQNLMQDLSELRFEEIKLKTLQGALELIGDQTQGIPAYLEEIRRRAGVHGDARHRLTERLQEITVSWPTVPNRIVINQMRAWWKEHRTGWESSVHGFYDTLGAGLMWPIRQFQKAGKNDEPTWEEKYLCQEWQTIQLQLTAIFDRLESLSHHGNPVLAPRLNELITGQTREHLLEQLRTNHENCPIEEELALLIKKQMNEFREQRADWYKLLKRLDSVSAAARPAITVALFATGFGPVGQAFAPVLTDTAMQAAFQVAGDVTAGTVTAAVGDTALSSGASSSVRFLEAWFHQLHRNFVAQRQTWFLRQLEQHLWGDLLDDLQFASALPNEAVFKTVTETVAELKSLNWDPVAV